MRAILVVGVPKSGTTAVYAALQNRYLDSAFTFLEPSPLDQSKIVKLIQEDRFDTVTKVVLSTDIDPNLVASMTSVVATLRDPRDVVVSWLPFKAVANPRLAGKTELTKDLVRAFERKAAGDTEIDITAIEKIYRNHSVAVMKPRDYAAAYDRLTDIALGDNCWVERFEDFIQAGENSPGAPEDVQFSLARLTGDMAVNQRSGRSGEWKKWFSERDMKNFAPAFDPILKRYDYSGWSLGSPGRIKADEYAGYLRRGAASRSKQHDKIRGWTAEYAKNNSSLFGEVKMTDAYNDQSFVAKLKERAGTGNLLALHELAGAVDLGYVDADTFITKNCREVNDILSL